jgi:peptide/nickel transport system permease protein
MAEAIYRRQRARSWRLIIAGGWLAIIVICAILAPLIAPHDPLEQDLMLGRIPPVWLSGSEPGYLLGTDGLGRDVLSRIIYGSRIALTVAFVAAPSACLIGSILGLLAGYYRGWLDQVVSRIVDIWMAFPPVLFSILLVAVLGTGLHSVIIAIVAIDWIRFCRVVRSETLGQRRMDYVDSARVAGFSGTTILVKEVLPNVLPTIVALLSLEMGIAVIVEAILSFVNLSISTDDPTWGGMIAEGRTIIHFAWWVLVFPLIVLFLTVLAFGQFGEGLKDRFDPVLQ